MTADPQPTTLPHEAPPFRLSLRVLVVDDNRDAANATADLFAVCGATAQACYGGEQALARLPAFDPDVCILDIDMPGVDGVDLAECILVRCGGKPLLVALTGRDDDAVRQRIADGAFDLHFVKPADPGELLRALAQMAARARAE
jgi:CheY-like chemotaxis protein